MSTGRRTRPIADAPDAPRAPRGRRAEGARPASASPRPRDPRGVAALREIGARAGNRALARLIAQRRLTQPLPPGDFRKGELTDEIRTELADSAREFADLRRGLAARHALVSGRGFATPQTDALLRVVAQADALPSYLVGRFSNAKRAALVRDYAAVRAAEADDLARVARNELEEIYPLDHVPAGGTLLELLSGVFLAARAADTYVPYPFLATYIAEAPRPQRRAAGQDADLIALATEWLAGRDMLPTLMIALEASMPGGAVAHFAPEEADEIIQARLAQWIPDVAIGGKSITGKVAVLRGATWEKVLTKYLIGQPGGLIQDTIDTANAFTSPEGTVFISGDRGNPGTMIHEGIHFYAPDDFLRAHGQPLNEGVTEYFARKITDQLAIVRNNYAAELVAATTLVERAGEAAVIDAYFKGDLLGLAGIEMPAL